MRPVTCKLYIVFVEGQNMQPDEGGSRISFRTSFSRLSGVVVCGTLAAPVQEVPSSNSGLTTSATHLPV